jgi:photosystem II stability/assembly factor-like uncharacterized protein
MRPRLIGSKLSLVLITLSSCVLALLPFNSPPTSPAHKRKLQRDAGESGPSDLKAVQARIDSSYGQLPLSFEPNVGQAESSVKFIARGIASTFLFTQREMVVEIFDRVLDLPSRPSDNSTRPVVPPKTTTLSMQLVGANPNSKIQGIAKLPGKTNYFRSSDRKQWKTGIDNFSRIEYTDVYPGVSLVYYGNRQKLEFDFVIKPQADPGRLRMRFDRTQAISLDPGGNLILRTDGRELSMGKPFVYQDIDRQRREINAGFKITSDRDVSFEVAEYDHNLPLVIDPVLSYSTYLGGNQGTGASSIAVDSFGNAYVAGATASTNFPTTAKAYRRLLVGSTEIFVTKFNSSGSAVLSSTYIGSGQVFGIAVDNSNQVYIAGLASGSFPTTLNAFQSAPGGGGDAFIAKIHTDPPVCTPGPGVNCSQALVYSSYLGGSSFDFAWSIAADSAGSAYIAGESASPNFPTTVGAFQTSYQGGSHDGFVTKVDTVGGGLVYSTYLGGNSIFLVNTGADKVTGITVDNSGNAYVAGLTDSSTFPTTADAYQTSCVNCSEHNPLNTAIYDAFVTKIDPTGSDLVYSTYLGGEMEDRARAIGIDSFGNVYVTGQTFSADFPTTPEVIGIGNSGIFKSSNAGRTWSATDPSPVGFIGDTVTALAIDPVDTSTIYAGVFSFNGPSGVFKTTDGGGNWQRINTGLGATNVRALAIAPTVPRSIYLGLDVAGVYKSTNDGESWFPINTGLTHPGIASLLVDPTNPLTVYAGGLSSGVSKSTDGGTTWSFPNGPGSNSLCLAFDPNQPSTLFAGRTNSVDRSTDAGDSWDYIGQGISDPVLAPTVNALVVNPTNPSILYAGTHRGIFKTSNGAATPWVTINNGLTSTDVRALAIDRLNPSTLYAGTANGIFKTTNGGATWKPANKGVFGTRIVSLALDPANPSIVYGGANGSSNIFVTSLNSTGSELRYSSYLGSGTVNSLSVDSGGNAYITGISPGGFPVTDDALQLNNVFDDAFISKVSPRGKDLLFSTYLGGNGMDIGGGVAVDNSGSIYVTGSTGSTNFPTTMGSFQMVRPSNNEHAFVSKLGLPITAHYDDYAVESNDALVVTGVGILGNDINTTPFGMTAQLLNGPGDGQLSLSSNGSFTYTPNQHFVGQDTFRYRAVASGIPSNIAEVNIVVSSQCSGSLDAATKAFPASGGTGSINVSIQAACRWTAVSNTPSVITLTSAASVDGSGTLTYVVAPNTSLTNRVGTVTVAGQTFTVYQGIPFNDVPTTHPFYSEIERLSARGITLGCGAGVYCPDLPVTREQMAAFLSRALAEFNPSTPAVQRFNDVPPSNPFYNFIDFVASLGITIGCSSDPPLYCPSQPVSREQMAAFIMRALHVFDPPQPQFQRFQDVPPANPFYAFIEELAVRGITLGCSANPPLYCPTQSVTRGQMAAFLVRAFDL